MIIRFEKEISSIYSSSNATSGGSGGKIYVFRLSELEWYLVELMEWNHNVDSLLHNENNDFQVKKYRTHMIVRLINENFCYKESNF